MFQGTFGEGSRVFEEWFEVVSRKFQKSFKEVSTGCRGSFKRVSMMCPVSQGCYKKRFLGVSRVCQGCFKDIVCCMALIAAIRAEGGLVYRRISVRVFMCEHT